MIIIINVNVAEYISKLSLYFCTIYTVYAGGAADRLQQTRGGREDGGRVVVPCGLRGRLHQLGRPADRSHTVQATAARQFTCISHFYAIPA
jgi:hypothetical protein